MNTYYPMMEEVGGFASHVSLQMGGFPWHVSLDMGDLSDTFP